MNDTDIAIGKRREYMYASRNRWEEPNTRLPKGMAEASTFAYNDFSVHLGSQKKRTGTDPRFKRVVPSVIPNVAEKKTSREWTRGDNQKDEKISSFLLKNEDKRPHNKRENGIQKNEKSQKPQRSVSDCTLHTRNSSVGEKNPEDFSRFTSATRLSKGNNWLKELTQEPEKRRSVITVIGQAHGRPFSTVLHKINQRRKLAKELDKHALCEAILPSSEKDPKNLIAKIDLVSPEGHVIYSAKKVYGFSFAKSDKYENFPFGNLKTSLLRTDSIEDPIYHRGSLKDEIPERDVSARKRKAKRPLKKMGRGLDFGGLLHLFLECTRNQMFISVVVLVCAIAIGVALVLFKEKKFISYFTRHKSRSWYDDLFT